MRGIGNPLYVNGQLFSEPVTISHVPGPGVQGILRGFGVDPSMGSDPSLGAYAAYQPTPGMPRGFGAAEAPVVVSQEPAPAAFVMPKPTLGTVLLGLVGIASEAGLIYHGYKRNKSVGWAIGWGILGGIAPIIAWPVAIAQGYGKPKTLTPNRYSRKRGRRTPKRLRLKEHDLAAIERVKSSLKPNRRRRAKRRRR